MHSTDLHQINHHFTHQRHYCKTFLSSSPRRESNLTAFCTWSSFMLPALERSPGRYSCTDWTKCFISSPGDSLQTNEASFHFPKHFLGLTTKARHSNQVSLFDSFLSTLFYLSLTTSLKSSTRSQAQPWNTGRSAQLCKAISFISSNAMGLLKVDGRSRERQALPGVLDPQLILK